MNLLLKFLTLKNQTNILIMLVLLLLPALPAAAEEINVYSYRQSFLLKPIFEKFTAKTGIRINLISAPKGLVERIKAEGASSPADILFTSNFGRLQDAVTAGITAPITDKKLYSAIPKKLRDPSGNWFPLTLRARVLYVSKERVAEGAVKNYEDLAKPEWHGKICTRSGTHSYNLALFASFIHHWGEAYMRDWLKAVKHNLARKPQGNDRAQVKAIKEGLCDIAIGNSYYFGLMLDDEKQRVWAEAVRIIFPNQQNTGTHINISGMALMKNAPNRKAALKLMRFMLEMETQAFYAEENHEYPVGANVPWGKDVASWGKFIQDSAPLIDIYNLRKTAFSLVNEVRFNN